MAEAASIDASYTTATDGAEASALTLRVASGGSVGNGAVLSGSGLELGSDAAFSISRPAHSSGAGAVFTIAGQSAGGSTADGGDLKLIPGSKTGGGTDGSIILGNSAGAAVLTVGAAGVTTSQAFTVGMEDAVNTGVSV